MPGRYGSKDRRRALLALFTSLLFHLLALIAFQHWAGEPVEQALHPVRFQMPLPQPERFRPKIPASLLYSLAEWKRIAAAPPQLNT